MVKTYRVASLTLFWSTRRACGIPSHHCCIPCWL